MYIYIVSEKILKLESKRRVEIGTSKEKITQGDVNYGYAQLVLEITALKKTK